MTDDTLVNGLKAIFGTSAQGSAPASSALIPYMDSSGNPVGLSSMSNLASVLGDKGKFDRFNEGSFTGSYTFPKYACVLFLIRPVASNGFGIYAADPNNVATTIRQLTGISLTVSNSSVVINGESERTYNIFVMNVPA